MTNLHILKIRKNPMKLNCMIIKSYAALKRQAI